MQNLYPVIRNSARALVIRDNCVLLLRKNGGGRPERFTLPGGAQDTGETLAQALQRECFEEIGTEVELDALVHVADYFKRRNTKLPSHKHLVEFLFRCRVPDDYVPKNGCNPDKHQVEVVWLPLASLGSVTLYPKSMTACLQNMLSAAEAPVYLGLID